MMAASKVVFRHPNVIYSQAAGTLEMIPKCAAIVVDGNGTISNVFKTEEEYASAGIDTTGAEVLECGGKMLIPGLIDVHIHAPQYKFTGTGYDLPLLKWLETYTFPTESRFSDLELARTVYSQVVKRTLKNGTTTAQYFATIHKDSAVELCRLIEEFGQRGFVGKVNMDRNCPDSLRETTQASLDDTEAFVKTVLERHPSVTPVITPRFVPTCSWELMKGLGALAEKYDIPVHSHVSENKDEVAWVESLHPDCNGYTDVYEKCGLLNSRTTQAHGCHLTDSELKVFSERGASIAHCPNSNFSLTSGVLNVRRAWKANVKVGLGTDVSGGYSPSMLDAIRKAVDTSKCVRYLDSDEGVINYKEAFHMATVGGAEVLGLGDKIGRIVPGMQLDALLIDSGVDCSPYDMHPDDTLEDEFSKFIHLGDDRNIVATYVRGKRVV